MLIVQIVEFEVGKHGPLRPLVINAFLQLVIFMTKQKYPRQIFEWIIIYCEKYNRRQCTLLSPTWAKSFTTFNPKMHDFKRVLNLTCK